MRFHPALFQINQGRVIEPPELVTTGGWSPVTGSSFTVPFPDGYSPIAGDLGVIMYGGWIQAYPPDQNANASGWTLVGDIGHTTWMGHGVAYRLLTGDEVGNVTFNTPSSGWGGGVGGYMMIFRNVNQEQPLDVPATRIATVDGLTYPERSSPNITTVTENCMIVTGVCINDNNADMYLKFPGGFERNQLLRTSVGNDLAVASATRVAPDAGLVNGPYWALYVAGTTTPTASSRHWAATTIALRPA